MTDIDQLLKRVEQCRARAREAEALLQAAEDELLEARFEGWDRYQVGDIVLVPRELFGQNRPWPAEVVSIRLHYREGTWPETYKEDPGGSWTSQSISYGVLLQQKDGTFGGSTVGVWHKQVQPAPAELKEQAI